MTGARPRRLLMWDVDQTLVLTGGLARAAYTGAFAAVTGRPLEWFPADLGGRTDTDIAYEVFAVHGLAAQPLLDRFFPRFAEEVAARAHTIRETGRALPGVAEVLAALAARPHVVQTLVTGNIPAVARAKLDAFGLADAIDFEVGGYGTDDALRPTLVRLSRERAERKYRCRFADVLVVGDTVHDVAAALANGVTAVGVATGRTGMDALRAAGARLVLPDLSDVPAVVRLLAGDAAGDGHDHRGDHGDG